VLFTAFEPSGDDHAAAVIAELRRRHPALPIYAWGGPKMERAGATIVQQTGASAVMGLPGVGKILEHAAINRRVARWFKQGLVSLHVPVDSPAANFPICRIARRRQLRILHLVAPQIWAWGSWRIKKLRRLTDGVLCLLPFEELWFLERGVPAKFIGHPLFVEPLNFPELDARGAQYTPGSPKIALMPGSRPKEIEGCAWVLLDAFRRLRKDFPRSTAVIAATTPEVADRLRQIAREHGGLPEGVEIAVGETDAVIRWCDYALVVSGTVTLQIAKQYKPMVAFYRPNRFVYHTLARWLVSTEMFTLPNLIAGRKIVPELIPHFGNGEALAVEVIKLMRRTGYADDQREALRKVVEKFQGVNAAENAADEIERMLGLTRPFSPLDEPRSEPADSAGGLAGGTGGGDGGGVGLGAPPGGRTIADPAVRSGP
jgi:lipid-A-disaccharide synthase